MKSTKVARAAVLSVVRSLSFEDRDDFIRSHRYSFGHSKAIKLDTEGLNRDRATSAYYPHYTVDNLFEYCVFRNLITLLNKYGRLPKKRQFTLGHWLPMSRGGTHTSENWIIQTYEDNQKQSDDLPPHPTKWTLNQQIDYIKTTTTYLFVDDTVLQDMQKYIDLLGRVYYGKKEKESTT